MSNYSNNQVALPAPELYATMTGSPVLIGTLLEVPVKIIFDNLGTVNVAISFDEGVTTWKTFPGGEALVLDYDLEAFSKGLRITGTGASGDFSVAYCYLKTS